MPSRKRPSPAPSSETEGAAWVESDVPWRARWAGLPAYEGATDSAGRPHGRGRLRLDEDGAWYEGRFSRGVRQGRGTLHFPVDADADSDSDADADASDPRFPSGGDRVTGTFADDAVEGWATYHCADGSSREGVWRDGELSGLVRERDPTGRVVFEGRYVAGARDGDGWIQHPDGGVLACAFADGAVLPGRAAYTYPDAYGVPARGAIRATRFQTPASAKAAIDALGESRALFGNFLPASGSTRDDKVADPVRAVFWGGASRERANANESVRRGGVSKSTALVEWLCGGSTKTKTTETGSDAALFVAASVSTVPSRREFSEPLESATLTLVRDDSGDAVRVRGDVDVTVPEGALVAFVHGERRAVAAGTPGGSSGWRAPDGWRRSSPGSGSEPRESGASTLGRWRPDGQRAFYLRANEDDSEDEYDDEDGREPSLGGGGAGGIFLFDDAEPSPEADSSPYSSRERRTAGSAGIRARCDARDPPTCRREKFRHPLFGETWALVAERRLGGGDEVTQPPDYEGGWRVCPVSEAGYYRHLARTPPSVIRERSGAAGVGGVRVMEHGPWRVVWLDRVEQGLAYRDGNASSEERFVHDPDAIGFEYVRAMATVGVAALGPAARQSAKNALCVGLGAGTLPSFFGRLLGRDRCGAVEIEEEIANVARECLGVAHHRRGDEDAADRSEKTHFWIEIDDAANFLAKEAAANQTKAEAKSESTSTSSSEPTSNASSSTRGYDVIFVDAYDGAGNVPAHLLTREFMTSCAGALRPGGAIVANCWNGPPGSEGRAKLATFCEALESVESVQSESHESERDGERVKRQRMETYLVVVDGQESNVVVVAGLADDARSSRGAPFDADSRSRALRARLTAALASTPAKARAALCETDRLRVEPTPSVAGA